MGDDNSAFIGAAASVVNNSANIAAASNLNKKTQKFVREQYDIQRKDALADWQMQNEYNSPGQQMQRLQAAGLNPNLVYGTGAVANNASQPRQSSMESWKPERAQFELGNIVNEYYDTKFRQAQTDNLEAQRRVIDQDVALRAAQISGIAASTGKTIQDTKTGAFNLSQLERLADTSAAAAEANLRKTLVDTDYTVHQDERSAALSTNTLAQGVEAILRSRSERATSEVQRRQLEQQIKNLRNDNTLKDLDIELKRLGINNNSPVWLNILGRIAGKSGILGSAEKDRLIEEAKELERKDPQHFQNRMSPGLKRIWKK